MRKGFRMSERAIVVTVDPRACIGCGQCVEDCFPGVLRLNDNGVAECVRPCLECGHCVAVCPSNAVSFDGYDMAEVKPCAVGESSLEPDRLLAAVKSRRSIRRYLERPLPADVIADLVEAVRYTPTAANRQGTRTIVVQERLAEFRALLWEELPGVVKRLEAEFPAYAATFAGFLRRREETGSDLLLFDAPAFVVISTSNMWDAGLAAANLELVAFAHGAGVLHSGYLKRIVSDSKRLQEWLGVDERGVGCALLAGYPAVTYARTAPRKPADVVMR